MKKTYCKIFIVSFFLTVLILISPKISSAATVEELQSQLNALLTRVQQLVSQLNQLQQGQTPVWCHTFNVNLKLGDNGEIGQIEVGSLRIALQKEGFNISVSGDFDETVASVVSGFQEKYRNEILTPLGLKYPTAYVGPATRKVLNRLYGCGVRPPSVAVPVNGVCGLSNGGSYSSAPTSSLCSVGIASGITEGVTDHQPLWGWKCFGTNGGNTAYCSAVNSSSGGPAVTLLSPNGGENYLSGSTQTVRWSSSGVDKVYLDLVGNSGNLVVTDLVNITGNPGSVNWTIPYIQSGLYRMKIVACQYSIGSCAAFDVSDNPFSIVGATSTSSIPAITLLSPNGGETFRQGGINTISWKGGKNLVEIGLVRDTYNPADINLNTVLGWITLNGLPNSSLNWDGKTLYDLNGALWPYFNLSSEKGPFKIIAVSDNGYGDYCMWNSVRQCNMDSSDASFNIVGATSSLPDIRITNIVPETVNQNQFTAYTARVENNSSQDINTPFAVNLGGVATTISSLAAWQTKTVSASFGLSILGSNQVCASADIWNAVAESNENNNTFCKTVNVVATTTAPFITSISPASGRANDMITIYGRNLVDTIPSGITIEFLKNGVLSGTQTSGIFVQSDGLSLKFQLSGLFVANSEPGTYQLRVVNDNGKSNIINFAVVATTTVNGICGLASNVGNPWKPNNNLCSAGTATEVSQGISQWQWSCLSFNGGSTANCSAPVNYLYTYSRSVYDETNYPVHCSCDVSQVSSDCSTSSIVETKDLGPYCSDWYMILSLGSGSEQARIYEKATSTAGLVFSSYNQMAETLESARLLLNQMLESLTNH